MGYYGIYMGYIYKYRRLEGYVFQVVYSKELLSFILWTTYKYVGGRGWRSCNISDF